MMKYLEALFFLALFIHGWWLLRFNSNMRRDLLSFLVNNNLRQEYLDLYNRYTGFFNYLEPLPDCKSYPKLYEIESFRMYIKRTKRRFKYFFIVIPIIIIAWIIHDLLKQY